MGSAAAIAILLVGVAILLLENSKSSGGTSGDVPTGAGEPDPGGTGSLNPLIAQLANAIAQAEGYGIDGAVPTRANNPGDLVLGDRGNGVANAEGVTIYASAAEGWNSLYYELNLIFTNKSHVYTTGMTFLQMAEKWTGGDNAGAWASNVAIALGVSTGTTIGDWIAANS